ncbi:uncharacterized protein LOC129597391 isoform X2 [Paramacrobiotus metropolitanus]|uniref:uncharacterized protein LOC129597391 isoform X2 n=1 Tax=Paramacrobiotus metropolitanus TaxID=2943436 RepID=UPI002445E237|nr:uncharacterized protein LOC129597391 isoform X2 [Paramacrobiotus metropolitanus]
MKFVARNCMTVATWIRALLLFHAQTPAPACGPVISRGHLDNSTATSTTFENENYSTRDAAGNEMVDAIGRSIGTKLYVDMGNDVVIDCAYTGSSIGSCHNFPATSLVWRYRDSIIDQDTVSESGQISVKNGFIRSYLTIRNVTNTAWERVECLRYCGIEKYCEVRRFYVKGTLPRKSTWELHYTRYSAKRSVFPSRTSATRPTREGYCHGMQLQSEHGVCHDFPPTSLGNAPMGTIEYCHDQGIMEAIVMPFARGPVTLISPTAPVSGYRQRGTDM